MAEPPGAAAEDAWGKVGPGSGRAGPPGAAGATGRGSWRPGRVSAGLGGMGAGRAHGLVPGRGAVAKGHSGAGVAGVPWADRTPGGGGLGGADRGRRPSSADVSPPPARPAQVDAAYGDNGLDSGRCPDCATPVRGWQRLPGDAPHVPAPGHTPRWALTPPHSSSSTLHGKCPERQHSVPGQQHRLHQCLFCPQHRWGFSSVTAFLLAGESGTCRAPRLPCTERVSVAGQDSCPEEKEEEEGCGSSVRVL